MCARAYTHKLTRTRSFTHSMKWEGERERERDYDKLWSCNSKETLIRFSVQLKKLTCSISRSIESKNFTIGNLGMFFKGWKIDSSINSSIFCKTFFACFKIGCGFLGPVIFLAFIAPVIAPTICNFHCNARLFLDHTEVVYQRLAS